MEFNKLLSELNKLNLTEGEYAIAGSGPLGIRKIRECNDLDIIISKKEFSKLLKKYPKSLNTKPFDILRIENLELSYIWQQGPKGSKQLISKAEKIDGHSYVRLKYVLEWKKKGTRDKDKKDLILINEYLSKQ